MIRVLVLLSVLLPFAGASEAPRRIAVHGHRGCRAVRPENTLAAFREALRVGVDVLELDTVATKDGVLVVSHDRRLDPRLCLGPDGKPAKETPIRELTLSELKRYDCGSLANPRFPRQVLSPGERIPTLDEVFALVAGSTEPAVAKVGFNIETKLVPGEPELSPAPAEFARLVVEVVRKRGMTGRTIVQSFDSRTLREVRRLEPNIKLSLLTSDNHLDYAAVAASVGAHIISPDAAWLTAEAAAELHAAGVQVAPWTVNDERGWDALAAMKVDAIITDDPERLIAHLRKRNLR